MTLLRFRAVKWAILTVASGLALAGCSEAPGAADPMATVRSYQSAFLAEDAGAACAEMTGQAKRELVADFGLAPSCEESLEAAFDLYGPDDFAKLREARDALQASDIQVSGESAIVTLPRGKSLRLSRVDGRWYIASTDTRSG